MLADAQAENDRLNELLASHQSAPLVQQPQQTVDSQLVTAPVSVFFNLNQATIASQRELQNVADLVAVAKEHHAKLVVTGYADSQTGRQLSQQRADAVAAEILKMGFSKEQLEVVAVGGVDTLSPTVNNRRVTVEMK